jgi:YHS domain-containing protein
MSQTDPVCGMQVDEGRATPTRTVRGDQAFYFCSLGCKQAFESDPDQYGPDRYGRSYPSWLPSQH